MINYFKKNLKESIIYRKNKKVPNAFFILITVTACTLIYILMATILIPKDTPRNINFVSERGAITVLSAIFLITASSFSLASAFILIRLKDKYMWFWLIMAFAFAFLGFDELLGFHEIGGALLNQHISPPAIFRNWNDIIVILYGVVTLAVIPFILPVGLRYTMVIELFAIAFMFYMIHTFIDSISEPRTIISTILEESAKLLSGEFLAMGACIGFIGILWNIKPDSLEEIS